jgi:hypothetical protein
VTTSAYTSAIKFTTNASGSYIGNDNLLSSLADELPGEAKPFDAIVYPNPAVNSAYVVLSGTSGKIAIIVTDLSGKAVWKTENIGVNQITIPVNSFAAGMYFISIKDEKHVKVLKLFKQ